MKTRPLHVAAVYPQDVIDNGEEANYAPWFVGHTRRTKVTNRVIVRLWTKFKAETGFVPDEVVDEIFGQFFNWLTEKHGYAVLHSAPLDGWIVLDRDELAKARVAP